MNNDREAGLHTYPSTSSPIGRFFGPGRKLENPDVTKQETENV